MEFRKVSLSEFETKNADLHARCAQSLLTAAQECARERGVPFARWVRQIVEREIARQGRAA